MQIGGRSNIKALVALLIALVLSATACRGDYSSQPTTTTTSPPITLLPPPGQATPPTTVESEPVVELGGTLAITLEHLVLLASPDGSSVDLVDGDAEGTASQPVWSPDGAALAWSHVGPEGESVGLQDAEGEVSYSIASGAAPFYLSWDSSGQRLAYLRMAVEDGGIEMGLINPGTPVLPLFVASSLFVSWAPNEDSLVTLLDQQELLHVAEAGTQNLPGAAGTYAVPAWSSESSLIVADADSIDEYNIASGERQDLASIMGGVRFVLSPDKQHLAYSDEEGGLRVLNLATGNAELVSDQSALAWEWSPDSQSLAFMGLAVAEEEEVEMVGIELVQRRSFVWSFWNVADTADEVEVGVAYVPSLLSIQSYLPFFEQYAQSHHRWSPDSNAFAFAGTIGAASGIWIQAVGYADLPLFVTEGDSVTWGPADMSGPTGSKL